MDNLKKDIKIKNMDNCRYNQGYKIFMIKFLKKIIELKKEKTESNKSVMT